MNAIIKHLLKDAWICLIRLSGILNQIVRKEQESPRKAGLMNSQIEKTEEGPRFVRDAAGRSLEAKDFAKAGSSMVFLALGVGFAVGLLVWGLLRLSGFLTNLVWHEAAAACDCFFFPVIACALGGLVIGLWSKAFKSDPKSLHEVMGEVKKTGGYKVKNLPANAVAFLLPLMFGGSVGPEAGLTGIIAAGCTWISSTLKRAGVRAAQAIDSAIPAVLAVVFASPFAGILVPLDEEGEGKEIPSYAFSRQAKLVLYVASAFGALAAAAVLSLLLGESEGLPRFDQLVVTRDALFWIIPLIAFGYALALVALGSERVSGKLAGLMEGKTVLKPVLCGLLIGCIALALPNVLFSGEHQTAEIMAEWTTVSALVLVLTGVAKAAVTPFCISMGWSGGSFFPFIFSGVTVGYGVAAFAGLDPVFCAALVTAAMLGRTLGKPVAAVALLALCFPVQGVAWMGLAAVVGSALPVPKALAEKH